LKFKTAKNKEFTTWMKTAIENDRFTFHTGLCLSFDPKTNLAKTIRGMMYAGLIEVFHKKVGILKSGSKESGIFDQIAVRISEDTRDRLDKFHFDGMGRKAVADIVLSGIAGKL